MVHFASACSLFFYRGPKSVFGASLVLVERVQGSPKQILALCFPSHDLTIDGVRWVECSVRGGGYRVVGCGERILKVFFGEEATLAPPLFLSFHFFLGPFLVIMKVLEVAQLALVVYN
ncbi:hypothetical protein Tco_1450766 [Tanacetum coccineum]